MEAVKQKSENLFEENGLKVARSEVEVGRIYPIYGMITRFIDDTPGKVLVEINFQIQAELKVLSPSQLNILKERVFESGIFVSKIQETTPKVKVLCKKIIFGKKANYNS